MKTLKTLAEMPSEIIEIFHAAVKAQKHSHSPYSKYKIGSAVRMKSGSIFGGCNVENASYGGTVCAERSAIFSAISQEGTQAIIDLVVISNEVDPWPPCGLCRQVIAEFATPQTRIFAANPQGQWKSWSFPEIMPEAFTPDHLK